MNFRTYLNTAGDDAVAAQIGVKPRTVASWRRGERLPRPEQARRLVEMSAGVLTWKDVYALPEPIAEPTAPEPREASA